MLKVRFLSGSDAGREIEFGVEVETIRFGRAIDCEVVLPVDMTVVARQHFALRHEFGGYVFVISIEKPVFLDGRPVYDGQSLPSIAHIAIGAPSGPRLHLERTQIQAANWPKTEILKPARYEAGPPPVTKTRGGAGIAGVGAVLGVAASVGAVAVGGPAVLGVLAAVAGGGAVIAAGVGVVRAFSERSPVPGRTEALEPVSRTPTSSAAAEPPPATRVVLSAYAPSAVGPSRGFLVQAHVHTPLQAAEVQAMAREIDPSASRRGAELAATTLLNGDDVTLSLDAGGLAVDQPVQRLVWHGHALKAVFEVTAPDQKGRDAWLMKIRMDVNGAPASQLKFQVTVDESVRAHLSTGKPIEARAYKYVFLSYTTADRSAVLARAQVLERLGIPFFQDVLSLRAGERWEPALQEHLARADMFMLFWSQSSAKSDWVRREAEWALERQQHSTDAMPEIVPIILDGPPPAVPPPSLAALHFNDPVRCIQAAYERAGLPPPSP